MATDNIIEPGSTADEISMRRKLALALLNQGMESSPIRHPLQGAARMAQSFFGGLQLGDVDADEKARSRAAAIALLSAPGLGLEPPTSPDTNSRRGKMIEKLTGSAADH